MLMKNLFRNKLSTNRDRKRILIFFMRKMMINQICLRFRRLRLIRKFWWCVKMKKKKI